MLLLTSTSCLGAGPSSPPRGGEGFGAEVQAATERISSGGKAALGKALLSQDPVELYAGLSIAPSLGVKVSRSLLDRLRRTHSHPAVRRAASLRFVLQYGTKGFVDLGHDLQAEKGGWQEAADLLGDLARSDRPQATQARQILMECAAGATQQGEAGLRCIDELTLVPGKEVATALVNLSGNWSAAVAGKAKTALAAREGKGLDTEAIINKPSEIQLGAAQEVSSGYQAGARKGKKSKKGTPLTVEELVAWGLPADFADYIRPGFSKSQVLTRLREVGPAFARIHDGDPWANHPKLYDRISYQPPPDFLIYPDDDADFNR